MAKTITIEIPADQETIVRQFLAMQEELADLALTAPDGTVLDACEQAVITQGRKLQTDILAQAVAQRIETDREKKGACSDAVTAEKLGKTVGRKPGKSSPPSA